MNPRLIFDIGMHTGEDTLYYLKKGFDVVGVEAREDLCQAARQRTVDFLDSGRLEIVNRALFSASDQTVSFFVNDQKDDWGSLFRGAAEQDGSTAREVRVATITLDALFERFGTPYYIKCDIEGGDALFVEQLVRSSRRPSYVSIEATSILDVARLGQCGYDGFQLVNQYMNPHTRQPVPVREGFLADSHFTHAMSGLFGRDLPLDRWTSLEHTMKLLLDWYDVRRRDPSLAVGWLDVHARARQA